MTYHIPHLVAGEKIPPATADKKLDIYHPETGETAAFINVASKALVDRVVNAANDAFTPWSQTTPTARAKILFRYKALLEQNIKSLAELIRAEHGKNIDDAIGSIQRGIEVLAFACGIPNLLKGEFADNVSSGIDSYSLHQPLGVCVGITPFNFPAMIPLWMFSMAIACGNTFVLKPSEKDPSCAVRLVELAQEAGLPAGVLNVIHGDKDTVNDLLIHPLVKAISFVGSSQIAEQVYKTGTSQLKRVQAFGGAKNHCIVMPDCDLDQAAEQIVAAAFGQAGERCMAISVIVAVGDQVADNLITKMRPLIKNFALSPLVNKAHFDRVQNYINVGKQEGAELIIDGSEQKINGSGFFMGAYLFDHVKPTMRIYREEIFGPVLVMTRTPDFTTALQLINDHEYGNGTAIFTRDGYTARTFAEKVQAGMVGINVPVPVPFAALSFGGWKRSVFSDIGMYGDEAIRFYTKLKTVTQRFFPKE